MTSVVAAVAYYAIRTRPGDEPGWLSSWAISQRPLLTASLLVLTIAGAATEWIRALLSDDIENTRVLQRLLDDFSTREFPLRGRQNRLTLFRALPGWRAWWVGLRRLPIFAKGHKWAALRRLRFQDVYLVVHLRASDSRSRKSAVALHISDQAEGCEGMAGLAWEENHCFKGNLNKLNPKDVRAIETLDALPIGHPIREYAEQTNVRDITLLRSVDNFARHFMGTIIRKSDGTPWGVLLLDSEDDRCPFTATGGSFAERFNDLAGLLGKFVG